MGARRAATLKDAPVAKLDGNMVLVVGVVTAKISQAPSRCYRCRTGGGGR